MGDVKGRTMAEIFAEMMEVGPYLPGTVRRDFRRRVKADGSEVRYEVQPRLNCRVGGVRKDIRVPKRHLARVQELTGNYRRMVALREELDAAAMREHLPGDSKKN